MGFVVVGAREGGGGGGCNARAERTPALAPEAGCGTESRRGLGVKSGFQFLGFQYYWIHTGHLSVGSHNTKI
jgi:hypothetical protein